MGFEARTFQPGSDRASRQTATALDKLDQVAHDEDDVEEEEEASEDFESGLGEEAADVVFALDNRFLEKKRWLEQDIIRMDKLRGLNWRVKGSNPHAGSVNLPTGCTIKL